jgi:hypothetical protein
LCASSRSTERNATTRSVTTFSVSLIPSGTLPESGDIPGRWPTPRH